MILKTATLASGECWSFASDMSAYNPNDWTSTSSDAWKEDKAFFRWKEIDWSYVFDAGLIWSEHWSTLI